MQHILLEYASKLLLLYCHHCHCRWPKSGHVTTTGLLVMTARNAVVAGITMYIPTVAHTDVQCCMW